MAKMTLLEMTQNILSAMNSDEVNSITDTVESQQVADEIKNTYLELYSNRDIPEMEGLIMLDWTGDVDRPNTLQLPGDTTRIKWLKYLDYRVTNPTYKTLTYLNPEEFLHRVIELGTSDFSSYLTVPLLSGTPNLYTIQANKAPDYYTIFEADAVIVTDSVDLFYESHLTGANSLAWGFQDVSFDLTDDFIAPIPAQLFPHFLAEAKSACFINIKEVANSKEEQRARRQLIRSQIRLNSTNEERRGVFDGTDYSRKR